MLEQRTCEPRALLPEDEPERWLVVTYFEPLAQPVTTSSGSNARVECRALFVVEHDAWSELSQRVRRSLPGRFAAVSSNGAASLPYSCASEYLARFTERAIDRHSALELGALLRSGRDGMDAHLGELLLPSDDDAGPAAAAAASFRTTLSSASEKCAGRAVPNDAAYRFREWRAVIHGGTPSPVEVGSLLIVPHLTWAGYVARARGMLDGMREIEVTAPGVRRALHADVDDWLRTFTSHRISDDLARELMVMFGTIALAPDPADCSRPVRWTRFARVGITMQPPRVVGLLERHAPQVPPPGCWTGPRGSAGACPLHEHDATTQVGVVACVKPDSDLAAIGLSGFSRHGRRAAVTPGRIERVPFAAAIRAWIGRTARSIFPCCRRNH